MDGLTEGDDGLPPFYSAETDSITIKELGP